MNDQRALLDQLESLYWLAVKEELYDAADFLLANSFRLRDRMASEKGRV